MTKRILSLFLLFFLACSLAFASVGRNFDGAGDRLAQGDIFNVTTGDISFCAFHKLTEDASIDQIIGKRTTTSSGYALLQSTLDVTSCTFTGGSGTRTSSATTDQDGAWYVTCCTWNGSTDISTIYVNGIQEDQDDSADAGSLTTGAFLRIGADGAATADYDLTGQVAYAAVYFSEILTVSEVNEIMWRPETLMQGFTLSMLIPVWGDASEIDLSANHDTATVAGTTTSDDGPPVMIGTEAL